MADESKRLNFEYNPDKIYEATKKYIEFKKLLKANYKGKVYLIENNIFEFLSKQYNKAKSQFGMKNILKEQGIKNKIISEKIKIIENVENIESDNLEIITENILISLGIDSQYFSDKYANLKVLSDTIQQIIFKDSSKLNISFNNSKKYLNIIESPLDYRDSNENNKDTKKDSEQKNNIYNINKEKYIENQPNEKINLNNKIEEKIGKNKNNNIENSAKISTNIFESVKNDKHSDEKSEKYNLFDHQCNNSNDNSLDNNNSSRKNSFCLFNKNSILVDNKENIKQNFYDNIKELYEQQKSINNLMNREINLKNEYNNYLLVNKNWFNQLVKIFENHEIYQNEDFIFHSFEEITNAANSKISDQILKRRIKILAEESLFKLELENEKTLKVKYPKEFILIEKESLNNFDFNFKFDINNNSYKILFGEKHIFVKDKENGRNIFVCSRDKLFFSINLILNYNKEEYFKIEIEKYIKNKGGIEHYIKEKNYDIMCNLPQKNMNKKGDPYGFILILLNKKENDKGKIKEIGKEKEKEKEEKKEKEEEKEKNLYNKDNNIDNEIKDNIKSLKIDFNPYIYSFLFSLQKIELLKQIFIKNISQNQKNVISNLLYKFLNTNDLTIINEIYRKINEINSNFKMNFKNLIDFLLKLLHKEFNTKNKLNKNNQEGDFDEKLAYKEFKKNYFERNDSFIQKSFFGIKEIVITYKCCGLTKYFYDIFEYIYIDSELLEKSNNLNDLISNWGNKTTNEKHKCQTCNYDTDCFVSQKVIDYPEFLIIILDNHENKYKVRFDNLVISEKYEYNLLNCISKSLLKNENYNVIINEENKWYILNDDNNKKEFEKDKVEYPNVFIFQKGKENQKFNRDFISNEFYNISNYLNDSDSSDDDKISYKDNIKNGKKDVINLNGINELDSANKSLTRAYTEVMIDANLHSDKNISENKNKIKNINNNDIKESQNNKNQKNMPKISKIILNQNKNNAQVNNYHMNNNNTNDYNKNNNMNHDKNNNQMSNNNNYQMNNYDKMINNTINMNNNNSNNYMSNAQMNSNMNNNNYMNNNNNMELNEKNGQITIYFKLKNGKEIFLDTNDNYYFKDVIGQLFRKYNWIQNIEIIDFIFNEKRVKINKTLKELGIKNNSRIKINN